MATLVLSAFGALVGGPLGGLIGSAAGQQLDALIFKPATREGPRLTELTVTTSSYGTPVARQFGRMRVAGTIIWATDLTEHRDRQSHGKGKPATATYAYAASFAVALSSRPVGAIGRIWADGKLLRGAAGDLKAAGALRLHGGERDQPVDPLLAAAVGAERCPAYRGLAYVVFEDLALADFGNRIPALSFEIFADDAALGLADIVGAALADCDAAMPLPGLAGFTADGALDATLAMLGTLYPVACDIAADRLTLSPADGPATSIALAPAATADGEGDFGGRAGTMRQRRAAPPRPASVLRYYDLDRDYLPGAQRAGANPLPGEPRTVELPGAFTAAAARRLIEAAAGREAWGRETFNWRTAVLDPAVVPGALVTVPGQTGRWRVAAWELRRGGVELGLIRAMPAIAATAPPADPGTALTPPDLAGGATALVAFELPWDGVGGGSTPTRFAAVSSAAAGWSGAALFADRGDGNLVSLGGSGRRRSVIGEATTALGAASPHLVDRRNAIDVALEDSGQMLAAATLTALAGGANRALLGDELIQFASAEPLGGSVWRLSGLLRGRGGTEAAISGHGAGERFVLLDDSPVALDPAATEPAAQCIVAAIGAGDSEPATTPIRLAGATRRPLAPVHGRALPTADGGIALSWTRRARGAWLWPDAVGIPLNEQAERYRIDCLALTAVVAQWETTEPHLVLDASTVASLPASDSPTRFAVRQIGDTDVSPPLAIPFP